jgi:3,4-dihydroxy 2-butanone 4-phosphate synthase/GTP cyclohydrolase II
MDRVLEKIAGHGRGVIVYLREGAVGVARSGVRTREALSGGDDHGTAQARGEEWREIGLGAQILNDLGVQSIRLIASRERHYVGLSGFGIVIEKTEIFDA